MPRFIAFDVETPNHLSDRMSAIFDYFNTRITGISLSSANAYTYSII